MIDKISVRGFVWDDEIIEKLWKKHRLEWWEVEEAVLEDPDIEIRRVKDRFHGTRWLAKGRTLSGRRLRIYMNPWPNGEGIWRCITAWEEQS